MISGHRDLSSEAMLFIFLLIIPLHQSSLSLFTRYSAFSSRSLVSHHRSYAATISPFGDTTCACAHYLLLRFHPLVPSLSSSGKRPKTNQGQTKDEPKNAKLQNVRFIKIAVSFTSLIPCLIPPRELRPTTERRATQLLAYEKCCLLRLLPKKVDSIPKMIDSIP